MLLFHLHLETVRRVGMKILSKASDIVYVIGKWITFVYILTVVIVSVLGVGFRSVGHALSWNEELMRWLLISIAYVGASVGMKTRNHIGIEFFVTRMPEKLKRVAIIVGYAAIIGFLVVVLVYGFRSALQGRYQSGAILRVQLIYVKMNLPLGAFFMLIHMAYFTSGLIREKGDVQKFLLSGAGGFE
jgi:TRAP-type C4-dicarboxylate transport system permease small subunit